MSIAVKKVAENLYTASAQRAKWEGGEEWSPSQPLDGQSLVNELMKRRFHPQDICDAMAEADPQWDKKLA